MSQLRLFNPHGECSETPCGWYRLWRGGPSESFRRLSGLGRKHSFGDYFPPSVSRDRRWLAFATPRGRVAVTRIALRSGEAVGRRRLLPYGPDAPSAVAWSPDGRRLALLQGFRRKGLWIIGRNGGGLHKLACACDIDVFEDVGVSWSERGIAFAAQRQGESVLLVAQPDGSALTQLPTAPDAFDGEPSWSPKSPMIAFVGEGLGERALPEIEVLSLDSGEIRHIGPGIAAAWSPDGQRLAYVDDSKRSTSLQVTNLASSTTRRLALPPALARQGSVTRLSWQP
jgi:Tol biopolymer transport system component